ncbi:B-cell receptor CD22-like [Gymnodraco acuticeps]|uniref:B-cell receptor CD22-like n=1 Tax=Gymnodraco acuticeps TaxID=8218 RepID=A0A6P8T5L2_GYMAC|nr:B-cell receptor CD22-like [Gymnodraco acuticeps]
MHTKRTSPLESDLVLTTRPIFQDPLGTVASAMMTISPGEKFLLGAAHLCLSCITNVQQVVVKEDVLPDQQELSTSLDQEDPEPPPHIKQEQEELGVSEEVDEADITKSTFTPDPVKSEDDKEKPQSSQPHQRQTEHMETEADGGDCRGPEPARNSDPESSLQPKTEDHTGDSSEPDTEDSSEPDSHRDERSSYEFHCSSEWISRLPALCVSGSGWKGGVNTVEKTFWVTEKKDDEFVDLTTVSEYAGRVEDLCENNICILRLRNLRESDSVQYKFRIKTNQDTYFGYPGPTLSVTDLQVEVSRSRSSTLLQCPSSCPPGHTSYIWFKNGHEVKEDTSPDANFRYNSADCYSCALKGYEDFPSPSVYYPKPPSVSVSPSAEIEESSSVTLTCSSDTNPAANYTWYKEDGNAHLSSFNEGPRLFLSSIPSSDSGQYYCRAGNLLGNTISESISIDVTYAPKPPSVSVSPSAEIKEGSSVTLTCSSDANPAANYTWYKEDQNAHLSSFNEGPRLVLISIQSSDPGQYYCMAENKLGVKTSNSISIDVKYAPKLPSVSVSPSAEREEGSSVTLTCSSDANPAANYTWYKEDEDSPKASGQIFTITDFRAKHSGSYSCGAQNKLGRSNSTFHLSVGTATQAYSKCQCSGRNLHGVRGGSH